MNLPLSWLKQFINIKETPQKIAEKLTLSGSEVEKILDNSAGLKKIVIGKIEKIAPHPDADKLQIAYVDINKTKELEIVCGASNIKPGQKVPVALLGGSVPEMKIEARKIRGVASQGMLCSQKELGIGDENSGIYILPSDANIGTDVVEYLELNDPVFEIDITPNRPDCLSIRGLAREVGALYGKSLMLSSTQHQNSRINLSKGMLSKTQHQTGSKHPISKLQESETPASSAINVKIEDKKLCPKYCARVIQGVSVRESPLWLQNRLRQVGIRSINNVVDVTNYLMMELGHPMHAFDANLLDGDTIFVRKAKKNEKILALDEEEYALNTEMLVIADKKKAVAIVGVMGGMKTGVNDGTQNIILESAVFDEKSIRKTSKALNLRSESSSRFEKGIDLEVVEEAINRGAEMIQELAGGTVLNGIVSVGSAENKQLNLRLTVKEVERILGINVSSGKIKSILSFLGFEVSGKDMLKVRVPSFRVHDIKAQEDLIEEIGRIIDYNKMPKTLPVVGLISPIMEVIHGLKRDLRKHLTAIGYSEMLTYSFYNEALLDLSGIAKSHHITLTNPVNDEYPYLRTSMLPWMLDKMSQNSSLLSRDEFQLFEIGKVFHRTDGEKWQMSVGLINITQTDEELYRKLRGVIESFIGYELSVQKNKTEYCFMSGKREVASIQIYPKGTISNMRFRSSVAVMIVDLENLQKSAKQDKTLYQPIPFYPVVERDLGVVITNVVQYEELKKTITSYNLLIKNVQLFDVYHGLDTGASIALRITFSSTDRTLESKEIDNIMEELKLSLEKKYKVTFR